MYIPSISFSKASIPKRMLIVVAGATVNIVFAVIVYFALISSSGTYVSNVVDETMELATVNLTKSLVTYTIYVWVDGSVVDNTYVGKSYSGYIHASAEQTHE